MVSDALLRHLAPSLRQTGATVLGRASLPGLAASWSHSWLGGGGEVLHEFDTVQLVFDLEDHLILPDARVVR